MAFYTQVYTSLDISCLKVMRFWTHVSTGEGTSSEAPGHEQKPHDGEEDDNKEEQKFAAMTKEEQPGSQHPKAQNVLELSFNDEHSLSELQKADEHDFLQSSLLDESSVKKISDICEVPVAEVDSSEGFTFDEDEMEKSSCGEELIEPSTDEELRVWRYPQSSAEESVTAREKLVSTKEEEGGLESPRDDTEKGDGSNSYFKPTDFQNVRFGSSAEVSGETAGFPKQQEADKYNSEKEKLEVENGLDGSVEEKSDLSSDRVKIKSSDGSCEEILTQNDALQHSQESQAVGVKYEAQALEETQSENADNEKTAEGVVLPSVKSQTYGHDGAQGATVIQVSNLHEMETNSVEGKQDVVDGLMSEMHTTESSRKVTFILEPELINSSTLTESDTSLETRTETSLSGETSLKMQLWDSSKTDNTGVKHFVVEIIIPLGSLEEWHV